MKKAATAIAALLLGAGLSARASAYEVQRIELTCHDRQEASYDNVYLTFLVDGREVRFGNNGPRGTSRRQSVRMRDGDVFTVPTRVLRKLSFSNSLRILVKEYDPATLDDNFGDIEVTSDGEDDDTLEGGRGIRKYEYELGYTVAP